MSITDGPGQPRSAAAAPAPATPRPPRPAPRVSAWRNSTGPPSSRTTRRPSASLPSVRPRVSVSIRPPGSRRAPAPGRAISNAPAEGPRPPTGSGEQDQHQRGQRQRQQRRAEQLTDDVDQQGQHPRAEPGHPHVQRDGLAGDQPGVRPAVAPAAASGRARRGSAAGRHRWLRSSARTVNTMGRAGRGRTSGSGRVRQPSTAPSGTGCELSCDRRRKLDRRRGRRAGRALPAHRHPPVRGAQPVARPDAGRLAVPAGAAGPRRGHRPPSASPGRRWAGSSPSSFPVAVYRAGRWWCAVGRRVHACSAGVLIAVRREQPGHRAAFISPDAADRQLVDHDFAGYYSEFSAAELRLQVWTNNAWIAAHVPGRGGAHPAGVLPAVAERAERRHDRRA